MEKKKNENIKSFIRRIKYLLNIERDVGSIRIVYHFQMASYR